MISRETKQKSVNLMAVASFLFLLGSFSVKFLSDEITAWLALLLSLAIFFFSGLIYVAAFLSILDDRKKFIETVKNDFRHVYRKTKIKYKSCNK